MSYRYDVFISYPRRPAVLPWVRDVLRHELMKWLPETVSPELPSPEVFCDVESIETGEQWPEALREGLQRSKVMVAVWTPSFFRSKWCVAEWQTMLARQQRVGTTLVFPIRFNDGDAFPDDAKLVQMDDFVEFNRLSSTRRDSPRYEECEQRIQELCNRLRTAIESPPAWDATWPLLPADDLLVAPPPRIDKPRL